MYKKAIVGFDNDGVSHDFAAGVWEYLVQIGKVTGPMPFVHHWHFYRDKEWGSMSDSVFVQTCHDGVDAGIIFNHGKPHPKTVEAMNDLYADGHRIVIVTDRSFGTNDGLRSRQTTFEWLRRHGFKFHEVVFTPDKTKIPLDFMVDDKLENYDQLKAVGVDVQLLNQPWNRDVEEENGNVPQRSRINSISEYVEHVRSRTLIRKNNNAVRN